MTDTTIALGCIIGVVGLAYGLLAVWLHGRFTLLAGINAAAAVAAFIPSARHLLPAIRYNETPMLLYFALESSIVVVFAMLTLRLRVPKLLIVLQAASNIVLLALLAFLLLAFRFTRFI